MFKNRVFVSLSLLITATMVSASTCPVLTSMAAPSGYTASSSNASCTLTGELSFQFEKAMISFAPSSPMTCVYDVSSLSSADICTLYYNSNSSEKPDASSDGYNYWNKQKSPGQVCISLNPSDCAFAENNHPHVTTCPIFTASNYSANTVPSFSGFTSLENDSCASSSLPVFYQATIQHSTMQPLSLLAKKALLNNATMQHSAMQHSAMQHSTLEKITCDYAVPDSECYFVYESIDAVISMGDYWVRGGSVCYESVSDCVATP